MEFVISDLLDELQEVDVDILPYASASGNRIKELTMQKMQGKFERKPRRHPIGKLILIAAVVAALAVPVMAASGLLFTDWHNTPTERWQDYDSSPNIGSGTKIWATSNWITQLSAENPTPTGLTMVCAEVGGDPVFGTLTTTEGYWLEKWGENSYVPMEGAYENDAPISIVDNETLRWDINWESVYGKLPSGYYRLGKVFTYENSKGGTETMTYYVKFRIFTEEMEPYIKTAEEALDALYNRESYHIKQIYYDVHKEPYEYYTKEIWKYEKEYLLEIRYVKEDGTLWQRGGSLLRDGKGYTLDWCGDTVLSGVSDWEKADYIAPNNFDSWRRLFEVGGTRLGEVHDLGSTVRFVQRYSSDDDSNLTQEEIAERTADYRVWNYRYMENVYTYGEAGHIQKINMTALYSLDPETANPIPLESLEVFDTPAGEIARVIEAQNVEGVRAFSWEEDFAEFSGRANTDGFINTAKQPITTAEEAIALARQEADPTANPNYREDFEYNIATAWFDESADMWKVSFEFSQDGKFLIYVYLNTDGITQMTLYPYADATVKNTFIWEDLYDELIPHSITEGFDNTDPQPILTAQDALDRARLESPPTDNPNYQESYIYDVVSVSRDPMAKIWKVDMLYSNQFTFGCVVCMDDNGITQLVYYYPY